MIHISVHPLQRGNKCFYKDVIEFCQSVRHTKPNQYYQLEEYAIVLQWPVLTSKFIRFVFTEDLPGNCFCTLTEHLKGMEKPKCLSDLHDNFLEKKSSLNIKLLINKKSLVAQLSWHKASFFDWSSFKWNLSIVFFFLVPNLAFNFLFTKITLDIEQGWAHPFFSEPVINVRLSETKVQKAAVESYLKTILNETVQWSVRAYVPLCYLLLLPWALF